jgi:5'(3')-deoxyribonucleotidase
VDSGWALWGVPNEVFHGDGVAATEAKQEIEFHLAEASSVLQRLGGARRMWCAVQLLRDDFTLMIETRCNDSTVCTTQHTWLVSHFPNVHPVTFCHDPSLSCATTIIEECDCFVTVRITVKVRFVCDAIVVHQT